MRISIGLNSKSINKAIKQIEKVKKLYSEKMVPDLLKSCAEWLINRANELLLQTDIGENVWTDIMGSWKIIQKDNTVTILNTSDKAVFVEFGVGIVGQESPHENASKAGYKYNVPSDYKYAGEHHDNDTWRFYVSDETEIDLIDGSYEPWETQSGRLKIITRGSPSVMYAYNALVDLRDYGVAKVWKEIKKKYLG